MTASNAYETFYVDELQCLVFQNSETEVKIESTVSLAYSNHRDVKKTETTYAVSFWSKKQRQRNRFNEFMVASGEAVITRSECEKISN